MRGVAFLESKARFLSPQSFVKQCAHCVQVNERHVLFLCNLPHGLRVIAVRICYVAVFIEGASLHRRDENRNAAARTRACDKFFERSFVGRECTCALALLLLVVVPVLYEQIIAGLHKA